MASRFFYLKTRALRICMHSLQFKVTQRNCHELHGEFCHTNIRYFGCLHPYLVQTVHHPRKITFSVLFLSNIEPVMWYFPAVLGIIPSHGNAYSSWHTCMLQNCCKLTLSTKQKPVFWSSNLLYDRHYTTELDIKFAAHLRWCDMWPIFLVLWILYFFVLNKWLKICTT